jgi:hypothetical protein
MAKASTIWNGTRMKNWSYHVTKFNHVDYGQRRGLLFDFMYNECLTLIWYDLFVYKLYIYGK